MVRPRLLVLLLLAGLLCAPCRADGEEGGTERRHAVEDGSGREAGAGPGPAEEGAEEGAKEGAEDGTEEIEERRGEESAAPTSYVLLRRLPDASGAGHTGIVRSLRFHPETGHLISGSADGTLRRWDPETGEQKARFSLRTEKGPVP